MEAISCGRVSLLTNVTLWPMVIDTCEGLTPLPVIVIVAPLGPAVPVDGEMMFVDPVGELDPPPPHDAAITIARAAAICFVVLTNVPIPLT